MLAGFDIVRVLRDGAWQEGKLYREDMAHGSSSALL